MSMLPSATIAQIARHNGQAVTLAGWVASKTEKGKLVFIRLRDGSGVIQCVAFKKSISEETFAAAQQLTLESSCRISGTVRAGARAGRLRAGCRRDRDRSDRARVPDPAERTWRRVPHGASSPMGALGQAARAAAHPRRGDRRRAG